MRPTRVGVVVIVVLLALVTWMLATAMPAAANAEATFDLCNKNGRVYGELRVRDDGEIWIQYALSDARIGDGWRITQVDYCVADEPGGIPVTKKLVPKLCQFTRYTFSPGTTETPEYDGLFASGDALDNDVVIAAHAVVYNPGTGVSRCLWSAGVAFGGTTWATYSVYAIE